MEGGKPVLHRLEVKLLRYASTQGVPAAPLLGLSIALVPGASHTIHPSVGHAVAQAGSSW